MTRRRVTLLLAVGAVGVGALARFGGAAPADFPESPPPEPAAWSVLDATEAYAWEGQDTMVGAVAYRDGFILVGGESIWYAGPGDTWADVEDDVIAVPDAALVAVATNGERLVAIGLTGEQGDPPGIATWTSDDGLAWRPGGDQAAFAGLSFAGIAGSSSGFALQAYVPAGETRMFISTDGLSWRLVDPGPFGEDSVGDVAGYRGGWLAVGSGPSRNGNTIPPDLPGRAWWSPDGISWHRASISDRRAIWMVLPGSAGVLAVGASEGGGVEPPNLYHSADGRTWSHAARDPILHHAQYLSDGQRIVRWDYQDDHSIAWSTNAVDWHVLDDPVDPRELSARIYLGPSSLLLAFEVAVDMNTPAERFVQLLRIR